MPFKRGFDADGSDHDAMDDDAEGHMAFKRVDAEAVDEEEVDDDTKGHMAFKRVLDAESVDEEQASDRGRRGP